MNYAILCQSDLSINLLIMHILKLTVATMIVGRPVIVQTSIILV